jgi:glucose-1-phosphate adenylyltransferase
MNPRVVTFVLAGGMGRRLLPLTEERAKPAVPFGGKYRIIDFALSNLINSGLCSVYVLVQYRSDSLLRHLRDGWQFGGLLQDQFIVPVAAQLRSEEDGWYRGTADAIFQNLNLLDIEDDVLVAVFGADHIYRMDIQQMIDFHLYMHADVTVAAIPVPSHQASEFGVIECNEQGAIHGFHEKSEDAPPIPGESDRVYASMGNYIFSARALFQELKTDAARAGSRNDFGRDILPAMLGRTRMYAYDYHTNRIPDEPADTPMYWRDAGTLEAYYDAQMDLCGPVPSLNLYNRRWPIRTASYPDPSAKFTIAPNGEQASATGSIVSGGCILSGGTVRRCVLGRSVKVHSGSFVEDSIVFDNCIVGANCRIRRAIIDENVQVPDGECIGYNLERDRCRHHVSDTGIVVVTRKSLGLPLDT